MTDELGGSCCEPDSGDCCGPGSWCCKRAGKHDHDDEAPISVRDLLGIAPNMTGSMTSVEWVRSQRDEAWNLAHRPAIYEAARLRRELADGRNKALLRQAAENDKHLEGLQELARNGDPVAAQQYSEVLDQAGAKEGTGPKVHDEIDIPEAAIDAAVVGAGLIEGSRQYDSAIWAIRAAAPYLMADAWAEGAQAGFDSTAEGFNGECAFDHCAPDDYPPTNPYNGEKWEVAYYAG